MSAQDADAYDADAAAANANALRVSDDHAAYIEIAKKRTSLADEREFGDDS